MSEDATKEPTPGRPPEDEANANAEGLKDVDAEESEKRLTAWEKRRLERQQEKIEKKKPIKRPEEENPFWYKDPNINIKIPKPDAPYEELERILNINRNTLEYYKRAYCRSKLRRHPGTTESYFHEVKRIVMAIEAIKDVLASRGDDYPVYFTDREHPDTACRRMMYCAVASVLYGPDSPTTKFLRQFRDQTLMRRRSGRTFVQAYNKFLGRWSVYFLIRSALLRKLARRSIDAFVRYMGNNKLRNP